MGTLKGTIARIHMDPNAQLKFCKARSVAYSLQAKVEKELDRLQNHGVIQPVKFFGMGNSNCTSIETEW